MFDIITIGTATYDIFLKSRFFTPVKDLRLAKKLGFPTGQAECFAFGGKLEIEEITAASGGGATNSAVTFSRQGLKTAAVFKIGNDIFGELIVKELKKEGIQTLLSVDKDIPTGYSTILLSPQSERTILVYRGATGTMRLIDLPFSKIKSKWLYITPSTIPYSAVTKLFQYASQKNIKVAINPSRYYLRKSPLLGRAEVLIMNQEEASYLTGVKYEKTGQVLRKLFKMIKCPITVMTNGPQGAWIKAGSKLYKAGIFKEKKRVDRTGAGDAFGSGFVAGLIKKPNDIQYAIRLAGANAASVVEHIGAKKGILRQKDFTQRRWKKLAIKEASID